jgi:predicted acetyltransferase
MPIARRLNYRSMNFTLLQASDDHKMVIKNLMQFYIYDFSEYVRLDVEDNGSFAPYPDLNDYWGGDSKFPYIIKTNDKYVGFVLVKLVSSKDRSCFSIAEFFILKKYRREGIGRAVAIKVFDLHKGNWEVYQRDSNKPAQIFWNKVISEYTKGRFKEHLENGKQIQNFES